MVTISPTMERAICQAGGWWTAMRTYMMSGVQKGKKEKTCAMSAVGVA